MELSTQWYWNGGDTYGTVAFNKGKPKDSRQKG